MGAKKAAAVFCICTLAFGLAASGCGTEKTQTKETTLFGKITAIEGTSLTVALAEEPSGGLQGTPPKDFPAGEEIPGGTEMGEGMPERPNGENGTETGEGMPERPDGEIGAKAGENMPGRPDGGTETGEDGSEKKSEDGPDSDGTSDSAGAGENGTKEAPGGPGKNAGGELTLTGEEVTVTVSSGTVITAGSEEISSEELTVGDIVRIKVNGQEAISIQK